MLEDGDVANGGEEEDTRAHFDGVAAEDIVDGGFAVENHLADFYQSFAEYRMLDVGLGLLRARTV